MAPALKYVSGLLCLATALFPACSTDSEDEPSSQAGSGGKGGTGSAGQAGSAGQGGSAGSGGGGSPSAGTSGAAGSSAAGSSGKPGAGGMGVAGEDSGGASGSGGDDGSPGNVIATCLQAEAIDDTRTEALRFQGAGVELGIVRRNDPDSFGTSGTTPWLPQRFALERGPVAECVSALADLTYTVSHHNFDDTMTATVGDETWRFKQTREDYDSPTSWTVAAEREGTTLWGPIPLALVSCQRLDVDDSCAESYQ